MSSFLSKIDLERAGHFSLRAEQVTFSEKLQADLSTARTLGTAIGGRGSEVCTYRGSVTATEFVMRPRRGLINLLGGIVRIDGSLEQHDQQLAVDYTVRGNLWVLLVLYGGVLIFYGTFFFRLLFDYADAFFIPFILTHMTVMLVVPYLVLRRAVAAAPGEIHREFVFVNFREDGLV